MSPRALPALALLIIAACSPGAPAESAPPSQAGDSGRRETAPAVATGDGVREPLNRRATINVNF